MTGSRNLCLSINSLGYESIAVSTPLLMVIKDKKHSSIFLSTVLLQWVVKISSRICNCNSRAMATRSICSRSKLDVFVLWFTLRNITLRIGNITLLYYGTSIMLIAKIVKHVSYLPNNS
jgi:hypothetical protein